MLVFTSCYLPNSDNKTEEHNTKLQHVYILFLNPHITSSMPFKTSYYTVKHFYSCRAISADTDA